MTEQGARGTSGQPDEAESAPAGQDDGATGRPGGPGGETTDLRGRAEEALAAESGRAARTRRPRTEHEEPHGDPLETEHELRVHQIELELQNDELRRSRNEIELAHHEYFDLFDLAPVGYVTLAEDGTIRRVNLTAAQMFGRPREQSIGRGFYSFVHSDDEGPYYEHLREHALDGKPQAFEMRLAKDLGARWVRVHLVGGRDMASGEPITKLALADITDLKAAQAALADRERALHAVLYQTLRSLGGVVERRDPHRCGHESNVADLASLIARRMDLDHDQLDTLALAGPVHDVGHIGVPTQILAKPGELTPTERRFVEQHPQIGYEIIAEIGFLPPVADAVLQHHERLDGSGYPRGLAGSDIIIEARVLAVADVVEAMTAKRSYRPAIPLEQALEEIRSGAGTLYDTDVVAACEQTIAAGTWPGSERIIPDDPLER